jgi:phosphomevalonate kinase
VQQNNIFFNIDFSFSFVIVFTYTKEKNMNKTTSARVSTDFANKAKERNLSVAQFADQCLYETQQLRVREQELSLSRLDKMERDINQKNKDLEQKIDTLTTLLTDLFKRLGE